MEKEFTDDTFLARWLSGDLSEEELREFETHEDFEAFKKIAESVSRFQTQDWKKETTWKSIVDQANLQPGKNKEAAPVRRLRSAWVYAVAAAALLLLGYFFFFQNDIQTISAPVATHKTYTLPDGSEVVLNALSTIRWDKNDFLNNRQLELDGEAYFQVKEGSTFLVQTKNGSVQVIGTSFNVFSRKNKLDVTCYSGQVGVYFDVPAEIQLLKKSDRLIARERKIISTMVMENNQSSPKWSTGESRFVQANLVEVIEELERQFGITISFPFDLNSINNYNGGFPHDDLETALDIIFPSIGYQYQINGKAVKVFK